MNNTAPVSGEYEGSIPSYVTSLSIIFVLGHSQRQRAGAFTSALFSDSIQ